MPEDISHFEISYALNVSEMKMASGIKSIVNKT